MANSIFWNIHKNPAARGSPALFLLVAPPSVAIVSMDVIVDAVNRMNLFSECMLGFCLILLLVLYRLGPKITMDPPMPGFYWPYVFPLAALGTASIRFAHQESSLAMEQFSLLLIFQAVAALVIVAVRDIWHYRKISQSKAIWMDPLVKKRLTEEAVHSAGAAPVAGGGEIA